MQYCIYLRKSRADAEAEARGEGETLVRHEKILLELSKKLNLNVTNIYREVVSGETIAARPVMQQLLHEVEQCLWTGVLVMEVERLARGDTIDQGIVAQTFKYSGTKIITPVKIYDPANEFDEEYFEFGLFMSRREYKTINRRLQQGRVASVKEGKYVGNKPPYGYERVRVQEGKGYTLAIVESEAEIVRLIFDLYTVGEKQPDGSNKRLGVRMIAKRLNSMKILSKTGNEWVDSSIRDLLINPVYIGMVRWNWRHNVKRMVDGEVTVSRPRSEDAVLCKGLHPPIISEDIFREAQELMQKNPPQPVPSRSIVKNPLSGLVICGKCGHRMTRRPYNSGYQDTLICPNATCKNVSSLLNIVERRVLKSLKEWLNEYKLQWNINSGDGKRVSQVDIKQKILQKLQSELETLQRQMGKTYDLLEQGVYDTNTFLDRSRAISERINQSKKDIAALEAELETELLREQAAVSIVPKVEWLLDIYSTLHSPKAKNDMLKDVLEMVVYTKEKGTRWHGSPDDFELSIRPKIPSQKNI